MNREIKFRVWDCESKEFVRQDDLMEYSDFDVRYFNDMFNVKNYILQQYTGLKDKNSKEIYEGDILRARHYFGFDGIGRCEFVDGCFEFVAIEKEKMRTSYGSSKNIRISDFVVDNLTAADIEVLGNIFENPELLK